MKTEKLRAFLLEVGDEFIIYNRAYKVYKIELGDIYYFLIGSTDTKPRNNKFGINSQQRVDLICQNLKH